MTTINEEIFNKNNNLTLQAGQSQRVGSLNETSWNHVGKKKPTITCCGCEEELYKRHFSYGQLQKDKPKCINCAEKVYQEYVHLIENKKGTASGKSKKPFTQPVSKEPQTTCSQCSTELTQ